MRQRLHAVRRRPDRPTRARAPGRGGQNSFPVMGVDVVEGIFEHSGERALLAARHLDRDRGAVMLESTARRDGQEMADIDSGLW